MKRIASVLLVTPLESDIYDEVDYQTIEFSSKEIQGRMQVKLGWKSPDEKNVDTSFKIPANKLRTELKNRLNVWYKDNLIDPLDPENKKYLDYLSKITSAELENSNNNNFHLNENLLEFCTEGEFKDNVRFNILQARNEKSLKYLNMRLVPQFDREIEILEEKKLIEKTLGMDPIDLYRYQGKKYVRKVYEAISHNISLLQKNTDECNIVTGDETPTFGYKCD